MNISKLQNITQKSFYQMKKFMLFVCLVATITSLLYPESKADAQSFECPSNPKVGDRCLQRATIRLRKVQSEGRDEFNQRYEPEDGWVYEDCDARSGERGRTGEVSGPNCVAVQAGNTLVSSNFVESQNRQLAEHMEKLKIQFGNLPIFADIESRARNEFSNIQRNLQNTQTRNRGVNINAWVAVKGGCRTRSPFGCINWGPGGSLDTDVIIRLRYVGTNQDASRILERYIDEANRAASANRPVPPVQENGAPVITAVKFREQNSSEGLIIYQDVYFSDPNGDTSFVDWTLVSSTTPNVSVSGGPVTVPSEQQKAGVVTTGTWRCGGGSYSVTLQATLLDKAGNRSNSVRYTMNCR